MPHQRSPKRRSLPWSPNRPPRLPPAMPQRVTTRFTLFKGLNGMRVGRAEQVWKLDGERYTITSVAEASGLFSLFASGKFVQESQGEITPTGLKPSNYRVERGKGGADKTDTAQFDWNAMTLTLASGGSKQTLKLPEGTQDLLSFMYQLAFAPPQSSAVKLHDDQWQKTRQLCLLGRGRSAGNPDGRAEYPAPRQASRRRGKKIPKSGSPPTTITCRSKSARSTRTAMGWYCWRTRSN